MTPSPGQLAAAAGGSGNKLYCAAHDLLSQCDRFNDED